MHHNYIRYEVQKRKYSSNVVIGIYVHVTPENKFVEKHDIVLMSGLKKELGDTQIEYTCRMLNEHLRVINKNKILKENESN